MAYDEWELTVFRAAKLLGTDDAGIQRLVETGKLRARIAPRPGGGEQTLVSGQDVEQLRASVSESPPEDAEESSAPSERPAIRSVAPPPRVPSPGRPASTAPAAPDRLEAMIDTVARQLLQAELAELRGELKQLRQQVADLEATVRQALDRLPETRHDS